MTYKLLKRVIEKGNYDKTDLAEKLDVYLLFDRITQEQYEELLALVNGKAE